jgi:hypothetical protein
MRMPSELPKEEQQGSLFLANKTGHHDLPCWVFNAYLLLSACLFLTIQCTSSFSEQVNSPKLQAHMAH